MAYAVKTSVSIDRSQGEIRKILAKHGATGFAFGEQMQTSVVMFEMQSRRIRFILPMPPLQSNNASTARVKKYEQLCRSRWRCLVLAIKSKLESVESGITTLEEEFLAHVVLPNGKTMGDVAIPEIESSYKNNTMPKLLGC